VGYFSELDLIAKEELQKMKQTAILINVARGPVVNNADLYEALMNGEIQAAGLDVLEKEPLELTNPLSKLKDSNKLIITPHLAWASVEARTRCVQGVYENIKAFLAGEPKNVVNP
jgi:glycerate dehydrogenase